jgi:zinc transport system substrate-binding protein
VFVGLVVIFVLMQNAIKKDVVKGTINVFTSFYPLAYAVSTVGGVRVSVTNLLPAGAEPHDFEPSPRDFVALSKSDLFFYNGAQLEPWIEKWKNGSFAEPRRVVDMVSALSGRGVVLLTKDGVTDPHVWGDPVIFMREIEIVRDALMDIDPEHAVFYQGNADEAIKNLTALDDRFREGLLSCEKKDIIVSHDAFKYLAREYHFGAIPIAGISPDEEPSPKTLAQIADIARAKNIRYVFFETTVSPKLSEVIAREIGGQTLVLNPLESLTASEVQSREDYISKMGMNLNNLRTALVCR